MLKRVAKKKGTRILLCWNRGLGDLALGLYAMVQRIRERVPNAEITFLTRENLSQGFSMIEGIQTIVHSEWKRGEPFILDPSLKKKYDLVIEKPSPTDWVSWQRGKLVPRLKWDPKNEALYEKFGLSNKGLYVGVQVSAETNYGLWRNWPLEKWEQLFSRLEQMGAQVLLFGYGDQPVFTHSNLVDLRGKTDLFELLSLIKNKTAALVLPDSGISAMTYYLDASFPIRLVTLWADPNHGILKQRVSSPNPRLVHCPLIGENKDLSTVSVNAVVEQMFPVANTAALILAGGQGTRLGCEGPKGLFSIGGKTLFQWLCEKAPKHLPIAIMTSPLNHQETLAYFKKNDFFGLEIHFFEQEMETMLDEEKRSTDLLGPNGNGSVFRSLAKAGLLELFAKRGIDLLTVSYVDNPLSDPFDRALISYARHSGAEITVQCIERTAEDRAMGVLVEKEGRVEIKEYMELDPSQEYPYAYSGQLAFDLSFFSKMATIDLPIHWVRKTVAERTVWKGEQFIFDVFPKAVRVHPFCVSRQTHYAPIKGPESIKAVEKLLRQKR